MLLSNNSIDIYSDFIHFYVLISAQIHVLEMQVSN